MHVLTQFSGGWDSVAAACLLLEKGYDVVPVFYDYEQAYSQQEFDAAVYACGVLKEKYGAQFGPMKIEVLATMHTDHEGENKDYIPMRNLVLGAHSINLAASKSIDIIAIGNKTEEVRPDDPWSFSDCSVEFYRKFGELSKVGSEPGAVAPQFIMPVLGKSKAQVAQILMRNGIFLDKLWSCYKAGDKPCGECYHCKENAEAIEACIKLRQ